MESNTTTQNADKQQGNSTKRVIGRPFEKGQSGNPLGRPKGQTLKEYVRAWLADMSPEEKAEFLAQMPKEMIWRMAEGNPAQDTTVEGTLKVIPLLGGDANAILPDYRNREVIEITQED